MMELSNKKLIIESIDIAEFEDWLQGTGEPNFTGKEAKQLNSILNKFGISDEYSIDLDDLSSSEIKKLSKAMKPFGWEE